MPSMPPSKHTHPNPLKHISTPSPYHHSAPRKSSFASEELYDSGRLRRIVLRSPLGSMGFILHTLFSYTRLNYY
ncbi:hypothetical protein BDQ17DRAFT_1376532 [Cyathus striatus]|nr:hypothetical protein BDQ17DRAFT_1376532 [Cyathus striatus]